MMSVKINRPLYGDSATGVVKNLGRFIRKNGAIYLTDEKKKNRIADNLPLSMQSCLSIAKKEHALIPKTSVVINGKTTLRIIPTWPDYWAQYLIDNPSCKP